MVGSLNCQHEVTEKLLGTGLVLYEVQLATQGLLRHYMGYCPPLWCSTGQER